MKLLISIIYILCIVPIYVHAEPLTARCSGQSKWGKHTVDIQIEIALPEESNQIIALYSPAKQNLDMLDNIQVGVGSIQVNEKLYGAKSSHRHKFIVTRLPGGGNSLIGFYLVNHHVNVIRADMWKKNKPFIYFDSFNNEVVEGVCE